MLFRDGAKLAGGHEAAVLALSCDGGSRLRSGGERGRVCVWDVASAAVVHRWDAAAEADEDCCAVLAHPSNPDITLAAVGPSVVWLDARTPDVVRRAKHFADDVAALAVHERAGLLAAADDDGCVTVMGLDEAMGKRKGLSVRGTTTMASAVAFRERDANQLVVAYMDYRAVVWDWSRARRKTACSVEDQVEGQANSESTSVNLPFVHAMCRWNGDAEIVLVF